MAVPRTYISKVENEKSTPTLSSLERIARALQLTTSELVGDFPGRSAADMELLSDPFCASLLPYLSRLTAAQLGRVLLQVEAMTNARRSRVAFLNAIA